MKLLITVFACFVAGFASAQNHDLPKVNDLQVEEEYKSMIQLLVEKNGNLESFVDILELNGKRVIVATVAVSNKKLSDPNNAQSYLNMIKISAVKGKAAISKFLDSRIRTESNSTRRRETSKSTDSNGNVSEVRKASSSFESVTVEESASVIRGARSVGSWYSADLTLYYCAIVAELPSK